MAAVTARGRGAAEPGVLAARAAPVGGAGRRWLMLAAEMAGLAAGTVPQSPDPAIAGWACLPRIATCTPGGGAASVRAARDFAVATVRRWGAAERSYDIAIVVSELLTNALRYTRPGTGQARPRRPIRLGLLQLSARPAVRGRRPEHGRSGAAAGGGVRRDRPRAAHRRRARRPVGLHHASGTGKVVWAVFTAPRTPPQPNR